MSGGAAASEPLGLRDEALNRLGVDEYLDLAVERARDLLAADATYLVLARDFDLQYEVRAVSGLDHELRGTRFDLDAPGAPNARNPHLPVVITDLVTEPVPLLAGTALRSLVVVPVTVDGRVTGALAAASERAGGFVDQQAALLQRVADTMSVAADRARLQASERERRGWFSFLAVAGDLLAGSLDQRMTMAITGQILVPQLATWCAVYLDDPRGEPVLQHVWHYDENLNDPLQSLLATTPPDEIQHRDDPRLDGEVLCMPLVARAQQIGTLVLGRELGDPLTGETLLVTQSVVRRAALAIDNARAHGELQTVGEALQRSLLPSTLPSIPDMELGVVYEAAGEASTVGGDFYDVFGGRRRSVVLRGGRRVRHRRGGGGGDRAGPSHHQGPGAGGVPRVGHPRAAEHGDPRGGRAVPVPDPGLRDAGTGPRRAVADDPRLRRPSATVPVPSRQRARQVGRPQSLLGVEDAVVYSAEEHLLERGDLLVVVTDGVLERRDGTRMLGEDGLMDDLRAAAHLPAQAVADRVRRLVLDFASTPQSDDMAILAIRLGRG